MFRKGHVVREEDIPALLRVGKGRLYVWEKKSGMLHENEGAEILRQISEGREGTHPTEPKEGKIELIADIRRSFENKKRCLKSGEFSWRNDNCFKTWGFSGEKRTENCRNENYSTCD